MTYRIISVGLVAALLGACTTQEKAPSETMPVTKTEVQRTIVTQVAQTCDAEDLEIYFGRGETQVSDIANTAIAAFGKRYSPCDYKAIEIEGHTDSVGDAETNMIFSLQRAKIVQDALAEAGIDANRIKIIPLGERDAIADDGDIEPMNRKTVVRVIN